jgi:hypothetical protein
MSDPLRPWLTQPLNARGRPWRLSDPEAQPCLDALEAELKDPAAARAWLTRNGFLTKTGKLPKKYGG